MRSLVAASLLLLLAACTGSPGPSDDDTGDTSDTSDTDTGDTDTDTGDTDTDTDTGDTDTDTDTGDTSDTGDTDTGDTDTDTDTGDTGDTDTGPVCPEGFDDCDGNPGNGCETFLATDPDHCGECDDPCPDGAHATGVCVDSECALDCETDWDACDDVADNGCETDLTTAVDDCGVCDLSCPTAPNTDPYCQDGCGYDCAIGYAACDDSMSDADGCEIDLTTDDANCGGCGLTCGSAETCDTACGCIGTFAHDPRAPGDVTANPRNRLDLTLSCTIDAASLAGVTVKVSGGGTGAHTGALSATGTRLRWTPSKNLLAGESYSATISAGLENVPMDGDDAQSITTYRVVQGHVATTTSGDGSLSPETTQTSASITIPTGGFTLGDFDGDGTLDLASRNGLLFNAGGGLFYNSSTTFGTVADISAVTAADLDGDGYTDLIVEPLRAKTSAYTRVYWGASSNPLTTSTNIALNYADSQVRARFADVDGDGLLDVILTAAFGDQERIEVVRHTAARTFASVSYVGNYVNGGQSVPVDLDDDGDIDLLHTINGTDALHRNDGTGAFTIVTGTGYTGDTDSVDGSAWGDVNGDGLQDLFATRGGNDALRLGSATGIPTLTTLGDLATAGAELVDLDADGDLDLVTSKDATTPAVARYIAIYFNDGAGTFTGGTTTHVTDGYAVGDLDKDGDVDILNRNTSGITLLSNVAGCGNGESDAGEECDDGDGDPLDSDDCDSDCTLAECGDGHPNLLANEECDDGNLSNNDACTNACELPTCDDTYQNGEEVDVDCGEACPGHLCAAGKACETDADCESDSCLGYLCSYRATFETGPIPAAFVMSGSAWTLDSTYEIDGTRSLISADLFSPGSSSVTLTATFGSSPYNKIQFKSLTNSTLGSSKLVFLIDGVEKKSWDGFRVPSSVALDNQYTVPAGTHTFTWRFDKLSTGHDAPSFYQPPYDRAWIDDVILIGGAP